MRYNALFSSHNQLIKALTSPLPIFENIAMRPYRPGDEKSLCKNADDFDVWLNLRDRFPHPYTYEDAFEWIELVRSIEPVTNFAITIDDQVVGGIGLMANQDVHRHSAEIGYWLGKEHWGKGIMTKVVTHMTEYFFNTADVVRIYALVFSWNPKSARVLEKAGYELEGRLRKSVFKNNQFCDQLLFARLR